MTTLEIALPDDMVHDLSLDHHALTNLAREVLVVHLYQRGEITLVSAAALLGLSQQAFHTLLAEYGRTQDQAIIDVATGVQRAQRHIALRSPLMIHHELRPLQITFEHSPERVSDAH